MFCRKDQATLTPDEKNRFVAALLALKANGKYDQYVSIHINNMGAAHGGPAFFPWHREFLRRLELDLQAIDASVTLPYWNWTVDNSRTSSLWADDFMGGDGRPSDGRVMTGPFAYDKGNWDIPQSHDGPALRRRLGVGVSGLSNPPLPTAAEVTATLTVTPYDVPPYDDARTTPGFRNQAEGWYQRTRLHNIVHLWVGGSMLPSSSANDPVFFLHHCFIDKMWADWQAQNPGLGYIPASSLSTPMLPWIAQGDLATPGGVLDHHALGYAYDTEGICRPNLKFFADPITLKVFDDGQTHLILDQGITRKYLDDPITLKFTDDGLTDPTLDHVINTGRQLDDPVTLKFNDDRQTDPRQTDPTLDHVINTGRQLDDPVTLKFIDDTQTDPRQTDPTRDHVINTGRQLDDPITLKFNDDTQTDPRQTDPTRDHIINTGRQLDDPTTWKFNDDMQTDPRIDPTKEGRLDTQPNIDVVKEPSFDKSPVSDPINPVDPNTTIREGIPFILSTPHHSMTWAQQLNTQLPSQQNDVAQLETAILNHERAINSVNQRFLQGLLTASEKVQAEQLFDSYQALIAQHRRLRF